MLTAQVSVYCFAFCPVILWSGWVTCCYKLLSVKSKVCVQVLCIKAVMSSDFRAVFFFCSRRLINVLQIRERNSDCLGLVGLILVRTSTQSLAFSLLETFSSSFSALSLFTPLPLRLVFSPNKVCCPGILSHWQAYRLTFRLSLDIF